MKNVALSRLCDAYFDKKSNSSFTLVFNENLDFHTNENLDFDVKIRIKNDLFWFWSHNSIRNTCYSSLQHSYSDQFKDMKTFNKQSDRTKKKKFRQLLQSIFNLISIFPWTLFETVSKNTEPCVSVCVYYLHN